MEKDNIFTKCRNEMVAQLRRLKKPNTVSDTDSDARSTNLNVGGARFKYSTSVNNTQFVKSSSLSDGRQKNSVSNIRIIVSSPPPDISSDSENRFNDQARRTSDFMGEVRTSKQNATNTTSGSNDEIGDVKLRNSYSINKEGLRNADSIGNKQLRSDNFVTKDRLINDSSIGNEQLRSDSFVSKERLRSTVSISSERLVNDNSVGNERFRNANSVGKERIRNAKSVSNVQINISSAPCRFSHYNSDTDESITCNCMGRKTSDHRRRDINKQQGNTNHHNFSQINKSTGLPQPSTGRQLSLSFVSAWEGNSKLVISTSDKIMYAKEKRKDTLNHDDNSMSFFYCNAKNRRNAVCYVLLKDEKEVFNLLNQFAR